MKLFLKKFKKPIIFGAAALSILLLVFCVFMLKNKEVSVESDSTPVSMEVNDNCVEPKADPIPISMAMDDNYVYPTVVSITSIMENKDKDTSYSFYIMHPENLSNDSKEKVLSLKNKYNNINIELIDMGDKYSNATTNARITTSSYYRLSLPELLPNIDKIIWLDGDTITYHDLHEMIDINMDGYYFKGFLDTNVDACEEFGIENDHYICAGVMLINLKELRLNNMTEKFADFISENNDRLKQHDQTVINVMCYDKIGILPAKFGIFNCLEDNYLSTLRTPDKYTLDEFINAQKDPYVLHCVAKPWKVRSYQGADLWWEYAQKTDYFKEIKDKYPI